MKNADNMIDSKLRKAAELLRDERKKEARQLLREVLATENDNLTAWELLVSASYNIDEETYCLKRILNLRPDHPWARQRLEEVSATGILQLTPEGAGPSPLATGPTTEPLSQIGMASSTPTEEEKRKKRSLLPLFLPFGIVVLIGLIGIILVFNRYLSPEPTSIPLTGMNKTSTATPTATAKNEIDCETLIAMAVQASKNSCNQIGSNKACYGNNTIQVELFSNLSFSKRGDVVDIDQIHRLSASPLDLTKNEWGIAIFNVMANLPRSLPGETVTLIVFGNTVLENDSQSLETFYFSSQLGQIVCGKISVNGLMVNMPEGMGVHFVLNGTDLTLMGNAYITAIQNGEMQVSLYTGTGRIISQGQEQYFGAGQQVSVELGGPNGMDAISAPSTPEPLSPAELEIACTMTGMYCDLVGIPTLSPDQILQTAQAGLGITPTGGSYYLPTPTPTPISISTKKPAVATITITKTHNTPKPQITPTRTKKNP